MLKTIFENSYVEAGDVYRKKVDVKNHTFIVTKNGRPITLEEWNAAANRIYPVSLKEKHLSPLVRMKENMRRNSLARMVLQSKPRIIADIGTQSGHMAKLLLDRVERVYCVDIDPEMVNQAVNNLRSEKAVGVVSSAEKIDLPDDSLDVLLAASILEHVPAPLNVIEELSRVVRKGGRIVLSVPNDIAIFRIKQIMKSVGVGKLLGGLAGGLAMGHVQIFSLTSLRELAQKGGALIHSGYLLPHFLDMFAVIEK